jgi:uncharacterized protein YuzE
MRTASAWRVSNFRRQHGAAGVVSPVLDSASFFAACKDALLYAIRFDDIRRVNLPSHTLSRRAVEESDEDKPGVILDYDKDGNIVGLEVLNASKRVENPKGVDYAGGLSRGTEGA